MNLDLGFVYDSESDTWDDLDETVDSLYKSIISTIKNGEIFLIDGKKCCKAKRLKYYDFIDEFDKDTTNKYYNECKEKNAEKYEGTLISCIIDSINKKYHENYKIEKIYKNNKIYHILFEYLYLSRTNAFL